MLYWSVFLFLLFGVFAELKKKKINLTFFHAGFFIILLMLTLRQGQGQDYYNYLEIYKETESIVNTASPLALFACRDPLYYFFNWFAILLGLPFEVFNAIFSFITIILLYPFLNKICRGSMIPLFIFYATLILPYYFNAQRQALTISISLGVLFPLMLKKRYWSYYLTILIFTLVHSSIIICGIFPFIQNLRINKKFWAIACAFCTLIMLVNFDWISLLPLPGFLKERAMNYTTATDNRIFAVVIRVLAIFPLFLVPESVYNSNHSLRRCRNLLLSGFILYSLLASNDLIASRMQIYFRAFEGYFLFILFWETALKKVYYVIGAFYLGLSLIYFPKDIHASMEQGAYENCNILTYPYLNVFDDDSVIKYYRKDTGYVQQF